MMRQPIIVGLREDKPAKKRASGGAYRREQGNSEAETAIAKKLQPGERAFRIGFDKSGQKVLARRDQGRSAPVLPGDRPHYTFPTCTMTGRNRFIAFLQRHRRQEFLSEGCKSPAAP